MVRAVNKSHHKPTPKDIYVARPSSLGNPYSHLPKTPPEFLVKDRAEAIEKYRVWLEKTITDPAAFGHEAVTAAMRMITDESVLVCWCKPKNCHADIIIEMWRKYFERA